jgi:hypothetical protein
VENVAKAEQEVKESRSARRIARLVEQRLKGKDYEQYLGIVTAIRGDFEKLSKLMKKLRDEAPAATQGVDPVDRIALYIDDLDRCPGEQVVRVLEAIHLLLAFELFVVVGGVDVRWAARSLAQKYPNHPGAGVYESGSRHEAEDGAWALDYLEKIFQIPFWVPGMEEQASRNLLAALAPPLRQSGRAETPERAGSEDPQGKAPEAPLGPKETQRPGEDSVEVLEKGLPGLTAPAEEQYALEALAAYRRTYGGNPPALRDLRGWGPQVARFSFRSGRTERFQRGAAA